MSPLILAQVAAIAARDAVYGEHYGTAWEPGARTEVTEDDAAHLCALVDELYARAGLSNADIDPTKFFPLDDIDLELPGLAGVA